MELAKALVALQALEIHKLSVDYGRPSLKIYQTASAASGAFTTKTRNVYTADDRPTIRTAAHFYAKFVFVMSLRVSSYLDKFQSQIA